MNPSLDFPEEVTGLNFPETKNRKRDLFILLCLTCNIIIMKYDP